MKEEHLISCIIPLYNTDPLIFKNCLSKIIRQTYNNIEIIIIDDCSNIDYSILINIYLEYGKNIKYIKLNENSGPGTARRIGMENCKGDFILFIDSDDELYDENSINILYNEWKKDPELNMVSGRTVEILKDNSRKYHEDNFIWVFGKLFKKKFLIENNIIFNDTRANEDNGFTTLFRMCTDNYKFIDKLVYVWKYNKNSITRIHNHEYYFTSIEGYVDNMLWVFKECKIRNIELTDKCLDHFTCVWIRLYLYCVEVFYDRNTDDATKLLKWCRKYYDYCFKEIENLISFNRLNENYLFMVSDNFETFNHRICQISFNEFYNIVTGTEKIMTATKLYKNLFI